MLTRQQKALVFKRQQLAHLKRCLNSCTNKKSQLVQLTSVPYTKRISSSVSNQQMQVVQDSIKSSQLCLLLMSKSPQKPETSLKMKASRFLQQKSSIICSIHSLSMLSSAESQERESKADWQYSHASLR